MAGFRVGEWRGYTIGRAMGVSWVGVLILRLLPDRVPSACPECRERIRRDARRRPAGRTVLR